MEDFPCKLLRANHSGAMPVEVVYLDTETESRREDPYETHYMRLAVTCRARYGRGSKPEKEEWRLWRQANDLNEHLAQIVTRKKALWVFAHNAFFDLQAMGFFAWFTAFGWKLDFYYEKGMTYILSVSKGKRTIRVMSTTNIFPYTLEQLGQAAGVRKKKIDFRTASDEELAAYCKRDVQILKSVMEHYWSFLRQHDLGKFSLTVGSQAMHAYRHRFMEKRIYCHSDPRIQKLEREAYYGGRTECFELGKIKGGPFVSLDVNSMYTWVMSRYEFPCRLVRFEPEASVTRVAEWLQTHAVVARCRLRTEQPIYAKIINRKACFPVGEFETCLCSEGLQESIIRRHLRGVSDVAVYEREGIFRKWAETLYGLRLGFKRNGNRIYDLFLKLLLNSLYGKWGQRRPIIEEEEWMDYESYAREEIMDLVSGEMLTETRMMGKRWTTAGDEPAPGSFIAISAHITEMARVELWRLIERAGTDKVLYCDTDSIKIRQADAGPLEPLIHPTELGKLKVEEIADRLEIWGLKAYQTESARHVKGIPLRARKTGKHRYAYTQFFKQPTHLGKKKPVGVLTKEVVKSLHLKYDKGIVRPGRRITPFRLG